MSILILQTLKMKAFGSGALCGLNGLWQFLYPWLAKLYLQPSATVSDLLGHYPAAKLQLKFLVGALLLSGACAMLLLWVYCHGRLQECMCNYAVSGA